MESGWICTWSIANSNWYGVCAFFDDIGGPKWFFITVEAVESFVEEHYQNQIKMLQGFISSGKTEYKELQGLLEECCNDEISHKDEAHIESKVEKKGLLARLWSFIVFQGSSSAVFVAKRI